jgi:hypothetical protein
MFSYRERRNKDRKPSLLSRHGHQTFESAICHRDVLHSAPVCLLSGVCVHGVPAGDLCGVLRSRHDRCALGVEGDGIEARGDLKSGESLKVLEIPNLELDRSSVVLRQSLLLSSLSLSRLFLLFSLRDALTYPLLHSFFSFLSLSLSLSLAYCSIL